VTARLDLEYDGTRFAGWARQPGRRTVQGVVEEAVATLARRPLTVTCAGRTDAGVHAWRQTASHDGATLPVRALNALLPADVAVLSSSAAEDGWNARRAATSRAYRYRLLVRPERSAWERGRALWHPRPLDREALHTCAAALPGQHDFTAFTPTDTAHVFFARTVLMARWEAREGGLLEFSIEADAFLRRMIRVLVGTMLECATGARPVEDFMALLGGAPRSAAGKTAPAHGLFFVGAGYGAPVL